jgi:hypothetical protein
MQDGRHSTPVRPAIGSEVLPPSDWLLIERGMSDLIDHPHIVWMMTEHGILPIHRELITWDEASWVRREGNHGQR